MKLIRKEKKRKRENYYKNNGTGNIFVRELFLGSKIYNVLIVISFDEEFGDIVLNFEEELKKFHPSLEIEDAEEAIYNQDLTDMADVLVKMMKEIKEEE